MTTAVVVDSADLEALVARARPSAAIAPLMQHQVVVTPYAGVMNSMLPRRSTATMSLSVGRVC